MSKNSIIKGTLILTIAGFATRIIGFFYRIYLSNCLGAEKMGVYQLIFPIYGICFTLYASGLQTSISRLVAAEAGKREKTCRSNLNRILRVGIGCSLTISCTLSVLLFTNANFIATRFLAEESCGSSLRVLALAFPFCGVTACINGFYYGLKKAGTPATTQLIEQIVRVTTIFIIATVIGGGNQQITCELAVLGLVFGEIGSNVFNILSITLKTPTKQYKRQGIPSKRKVLKELLSQAIPLTSNRLLISVMSSIEAVLIPIMLRQSGLSVSDSLSIFGILTGMALPFILFPSAITNSFAVMLLPTVSEAQATKDNRLINRTTELSIKYSLIIGILSSAIFIIFGGSLGTLIYHNELAGNFIMTLAWLCPFLYLTTTMSSILNGLGKAHITFINSIVGLTIRIICVVFAVPRFGISGYLIGLLISHLIISVMDILAVKRNIHIEFDCVNWILKPGIILALLGFITYRIYAFFMANSTIHPLILLVLFAFAFILVYICSLFISKSVKKTEFR